MGQNFNTDIIAYTDTVAIQELATFTETMAATYTKFLCLPEGSLMRTPDVDELTVLARGNLLIRMSDKQGNIAFMMVAMINSGIYPPWDPDNLDGPWVKVQWGFIDPTEFNGMLDDKIYVEMNQLIGGKLWGKISEEAADLHDLIKASGWLGTIGFEEPVPGYYTCLDLE